jgi:hypothetical protein
MDFKNMKARKVCLSFLGMLLLALSETPQVGIFTDSNVVKLYPVKTASECPTQNPKVLIRT